MLHQTENACLIKGKLFSLQSNLPLTQRRLVASSFLRGPAFVSAESVSYPP